MSTFKILGKTVRNAVLVGPGYVKGGADALAEAIERSNNGVVRAFADKSIKATWNDSKDTGYRHAEIGIGYAEEGADYVIDAVGNGVDAVMDMFKDEVKVKSPAGYGSFGKK